MNTSHTKQNSTWLRFAIASLVLVFYACTSVLVYQDTAYVFILEENGPLENATVIAYVYCIAYMLLQWPRTQLKINFYWLALLVAFVLRELDFDKRFTSMGILKSRFYLSADVPLLEKAIGALVILSLLAILFWIVKRHILGRSLSDILTAAKDSYVLYPLALIVVSKSLDGIGRKLSDMGILISDSAVRLSAFTEEFLEFFIPVTIAYALWLDHRRRQFLRETER